MLIKGKELKGYRLDSKDGPIGSAREFYFDDHYWSIRYLVAKTSGWLSNNKVLLSPYSVTTIDPVTETGSLSLSRRSRSKTVHLLRRMSRFHFSSRTLTTTTMDIPRIGAAHSCGDTTRIQYVTVPNGAVGISLARLGTGIFAVRTKSPATTFSRRTVKSDTSRISSSMRKPGQSGIWLLPQPTSGPAKGF